MVANLAAAEDLGLKDLVERAITRDQAAFGELYTLYVDRVYRHVYYLIGNPQEAEDITAQTFMQAWQAIERYQLTGAPFVTWLIRIAHNLAISYHRRRRNSSVLEEAVTAADNRSTPESVYQMLEEHTRLMQALRRLRGAQRQVIILRFIDDLDYRSVAEIMGKSVAAVRVIQHRALAALRRALEEADRPQVEPPPARISRSVRRSHWPVR